MAYQYKAAKARSKGRDATWSEVNLANADLHGLYQTYGKVYLTLTNPAIDHDVYLDMDTARPVLAADTRPKTVAQWLASLGNATLPTIDAIPPLNERHIQCADVWRAGYDVYPVDRKVAWNAQLPHGAKNDLLLRRDDIDFMDMWKYCMVTVNGFFHRVGGSPDGLYVVDGGRTGRLANDNHLTLFSFREVGELQYIPVVPGMVYKNHPDQKYANYANIRLPVDVENKTLMMVIGGYLHILDGTYTQTGPNTVRVDFNNYAFPERLYDSLGVLNTENLQLNVVDKNPTLFERADLYDDATIEAYLTLPQTFFVVVNAPNLYVRKHLVEKSKLPGRFITHAEGFKRLPLISALGRIYDYQPFPEWGRMVLACDNAQDNHYNFNTTMWQDETSVDATKYSSNPWNFAQGYLLELGRYG